MFCLECKVGIISIKIILHVHGFRLEWAWILLMIFLFQMTTMTSTGVTTFVAIIMMTFQTIHQIRHGRTWWLLFLLPPLRRISLHLVLVGGKIKQNCWRFNSILRCMYLWKTLLPSPNPFSFFFFCEEEEEGEEGVDFLVGLIIWLDGRYRGDSAEQNYSSCFVFLHLSFSCVFCFLHHILLSVCVCIIPKMRDDHDMK